MLIYGASGQVLSLEQKGALHAGDLSSILNWENSLLELLFHSDPGGFVYWSISRNTVNTVNNEMSSILALESNLHANNIL